LEYNNMNTDYYFFDDGLGLKWDSLSLSVHLSVHLSVCLSVCVCLSVICLSD
jgi:hypothetical protein